MAKQHEPEPRGRPSPGEPQGEQPRRETLEDPKVRPPLPPERPAAPAEDQGLRPMEKADAGGPVPRVISQNLRAPEGLFRFKCRADIPGEATPSWYILARDEQSAVGHYLEKSGLRERVDRLRKASEASPTPVPVLEPVVVAKKLPD